MQYGWVKTRLSLFNQVITSYWLKDNRIEMQWSVQITGSRNCTGTVIGSVKGFWFLTIKALAKKIR